MFKNLLIILLVVIPFNSFALEKETTFDQQKFKKALSDGKVVVVSSWIKYCYSCASQMKVLKEAKKEFDNIEKKVSSFNSPGLKAAYADAIKKSFQGNKFNPKLAINLLDAYFNR